MKMPGKKAKRRKQRTEFSQAGVVRRRVPAGESGWGGG